MLLLLACGTPKGLPPGTVPGTAQPRALPPQPLAQVFVLEASGALTEDTTVTVSAGAPRVVVVRRSAPDYAIFARVQVPATTATGPAPAGPIKLTLSPRPGVYGLDLAADGVIGAGAIIVFSYGAHFVAPAGARERYGSNLAFEKELAIGRVDSTGTVIFLPTSRPGSDMLSAPLPGPGRYLVAAPR